MKMHLLYLGLVTIVTLLLQSHVIAQNQSDNPKPNIILINVDDMGWRDVGFMGSEYYETPNLDELAAEGMIFTNAYASASNCAPSRACLMGGQWTPRHGIYTVDSSERGQSRDRKLVPVKNNTVLPDSQYILTEALKDAGYVTCHAGKWHLSDDPTTQGFDINIGGTHAGHPGSYYPPYKNVPLQPPAEDYYLTNLIMDKILDFLTKVEDKPFFLYYSPYAVHTPINPVKELLPKYLNKQPRNGQSNAEYATMVENLDTQIGRLISKLKKTGLLNNTFILFTSDNGGHYGITRQLPLRSGKGSYYEGGIREPMFVRWPGKVTPGTKIDIPVTNIDFYPTILEVAGIKKPVDKVLDGQSIIPVLTGKGTLKERPLFWHFPVYLQAYLKEGDPTQDPLFRTRPGSAVRLGDWKLIQYFENNDIELYNLNEDISEKNNLARTNPQKVKELLGLLEGWRAKTNAPIPTELNPEYTGTLKIFNSAEEQRFAHSMLETFVNNNIDSCFNRRDSILSGFRSPADWINFQKQVRDKLSAIFGEFPEKTPLNPSIISRKEYSDYYMEKVIYESQPDYYVPANLYIPKNRNFPLPGVLFTIGHSDEGKAQKLYHETCLGLVKKGYVVLAADPIGQGERSEYFDPETMQNLIRLGVDQHHYVGRPAFLADWSLSGIRTWDCIRAVDYLVSRPEVDTTKLAVTGNSGGGQMALLTAAVDTRIKVVAAAHPGGSMENTYLTGQTLTDRDLLCLIPPRPCRIIVGDASGEQYGHMKKLDDMERFYRGLGVDDDHWDMDIVDGVHDMKQPKRESAYEWINLWFDKVEEGKEEPVLTPEDPKSLWCTENGNSLKDLGGESGQTLIQKRAEQIYNPAGNPEELKKNILKRLRLKIPANESPSVNRREFFTEDNISVEKFTYTVEKNIEIPSLLLRPVDIKERKQLIFHISDKGKPDNFDSSPLIFALVRAGFPVLSIDVRGTGETGTLPLVGEINRFTGYTPDKWKYERLAIQSASFRRTMDGMRALDVIKGIDLVKSREDLNDKSVIMLGEGEGGLRALLANICRSEVQGVITLCTLPSYKFLIAGKYYDQHGYFWVPGVLRDYDIPDLVNLADTKRQLWINPVNELSEIISSEQLTDIIPKYAGINIITTQHEETDFISKKITEFIDSGL